MPSKSGYDAVKFASKPKLSKQVKPYGLYQKKKKKKKGTFWLKGA